VVALAVALGVLLAGGWAAAGARPAAAHATLVGTTPAHGERLERSPGSVTVTFDEPVTLLGDSLAVTGSDGTRHDAGTVVYDEARASVTTDVAPDLPDGSYVVSWRILSLDTHVTGGSVSFVVGEHEPPGAPVPVADPSRPLAEAAAPVGRWITSTGVTLLVGVAVVLARAAGHLDSARTVRGLQALGAAALLLGGAIQLLAQVVATSAQPDVGALGDTAAWRSTVMSPFGAALAVRLVAVTTWVIALPGRRLPGERSSARARSGLLVLLAVTIGASVATTGHASAAARPALAVALTTVHVLGAATWTAVLVLVVSLHRGTTALAVRALLPAWGSLALVAAGAVVASGLLRAVTEVSPFAALWSTTYGRLLCAKAGLVVALILLGRAAHRHTLGLRQLPDARFRRGVAAEVAVAAAVLAVSAVLATTAPARSAYAPSWADEVRLGDVVARVSVPQVRTGAVELAVDLWHDAGPGDAPPLPDEVTVALRQDERGLGPMGVVLRRDYSAAAAGPPATTRYVSVGAVLPADGAWEVDLVVTLDATTAHAARLDLHVP